MVRTFKSRNIPLVSAVRVRSWSISCPKAANKNVISVRCGLAMSLCTRAETDLGLGNGNPVMLVLIDLIPEYTEDFVSNNNNEINNNYNCYNVFFFFLSRIAIRNCVSNINTYERFKHNSSIKKLTVTIIGW